LELRIIKLIKAEDEISKRLNDSNISEHHQALNSKQVSEKGERLDTENILEEDKETGEAGMKKEDKNFKTITSNNEDILNERLESTDSFIPFSQRTSLTHAPTIYEELIQKYESDIRNHIRIEQQMKLHSDSVINKLEDKEKIFDKTCDKIKNLEQKIQNIDSKFRIESKILKEENEVLKKSLEKRIEKILTLEMTLKESNLNCTRLEGELNKIRAKKYRSEDITPCIKENNFSE